MKTELFEQSVTERGLIERPEPTADEEELGDGLLLSAESDYTPTLTVILPTLNEERGISQCIQQIKTAISDLGVMGEIIVSDNSTDRTPEIARQHGAIVIEPDHEGYGYAYQYAFEQARGEYIAIGDADTTYDFTALPRLLAPVVKGETDIVLGSRFAGEIQSGAMPALHQYVGNPLLTKFLNTFYGAGVSDAHSGFRVLSRDALEQLELESHGMEFASEMIMDASVKGLTIEEVPITYHDRVGEETLNSFRDGWRHVRFMLLNAPNYIFSLPGTLLTVLGMSLLLISTANIQFAGITFAIHTAIAGSLLTIVGYQIASLAVFSSVAADTIREPQDTITQWITDHVRFEHGTTAGLVFFTAGSLYATNAVIKWIKSGYTTLPAITHNMAAFTAIVMGIQTIFHTFFLSMLAGTDN